MKIEEFVIEGFKKTNPNQTDNKSFVLIDKVDNFITHPPKDFDYHRYANSLKSSQAFAYNIFSGIKSSEFEFHMKVFNTDAQIDVKVEKDNIVELFEVKAFEINDLCVNKIVFKEKYFDDTQYKYIHPDIAKQFIGFLKDVIDAFNEQKIYGGGIKQLCSHLLGIINTMEKQKYKNKKFQLYSFCLDNPFSKTFESNVINYKETLTTFKNIVDKFLIEIKANDRVEYGGFLSASEYIRKNKEFIGAKNYDYVMKRYFYKD